MVKETAPQPTNQGLKALEVFRVARYRIELEAGPQGLLLPQYKGSTLRGGFGRVFRRICCAQRQDQCHGCLLRETCPYAYIFETAPPAGAAVLRNLENIPRPFVIEPPLDTRQEYRPGDKLSFGLVLIGKGIQYLPYFIVCFDELGRVGIGKGRKPYRLGSVHFVSADGTEKPIYDPTGRTVRDAGTVCTGEEIMATAPAPGATEQVRLQFLTMTRLKHGDNFVSALPFHILVRNLLRRISSLMYFHHGIAWEADFAELIERAGQVRTSSQNLQWVDWERYSGRRDARITLGGLVGTVTYAGAINEFWPLLSIGEYVHVGKGAVFGMGRYSIQ